MTLSLLLADDGSPAAEAATHAAGALFPGAGAVVLTVRKDPLRLVEVSASARIAVPDAVISEGAAALDKETAAIALATVTEGTERATAAGLDARPRMVDEPGSPWRAIRRVAEEIGADVIVCGSRGQSGLSRAFLGSTSSALLHHAGRPVLVVPDGGGGEGGPAVIGFDGSDPSKAAIEAAARLLPDRAALVVTVWESAILHSRAGRLLASVPVEEIREMTRDLDDYYRGIHAGIAGDGAELATGAGLAATPEAVEADGLPWRGLLAVARERGAAVVVSGSNGGGMLALLGSNSAGLVHNADLPVLVVPGGD